MHADLSGPFEVPSIGLTKYFLLLKDDYSNFIVVYFLKYKSETKCKLDQYIKWFYTQTGKKVQTLRTDNGIEFANQEVRLLLNKYGIRHERTCAYTPEQNGKVEITKL